MCTRLVCRWQLNETSSTLSPPQDWPPKFDSYLKLKYFWFVFVFLNGIWVVIPFYIYYRAYHELDTLIRGKSKKRE